MRSSARLSDCNRICLRRSVPICIRQTFNVGFQERLGSSLRESNIGFETLDRGKKCLEHSGHLYTNPKTVSVQPSESN